jgi:hypothetical protein
MDLTASFLAGSILGLVLPISLLAVVSIWWGTIMRRRSGGDS